ncbi:hypothetical protein EG68_07221 [Paragonimus skrjabini miyazakii]|uniref:SCP domain-containing protein n=1 Tax=Paragonimus skrjabini miyazakii TaxID=59628 RepID=A0A8S9YSU4_9TREM|nr:hypothetical protein EG68_07221 [Paragonimus skrjabini miyazakii]
MGSNSSKIPTNPYAAISKGFNRECFLEHNRLRAIHNSPNLRLDKKLMNSAQKHAEAMARENQLRMQEDIEYGQNAAMQVFSNYLTISGTEVARLWYKHSANYDYSENNQFDKRNFTQIVWKNTERVGFGCAINEDFKTVFMVGHYWPPGNIEGGFLENVIKPRVGDTSSDGWNLLAHDRTMKTTKMRRRRKCHKSNKTEQTNRMSTNAYAYSFNTNH